MKKIYKPSSFNLKTKKKESMALIVLYTILLTFLSICTIVGLATNNGQAWKVMCPWLYFVSVWINLAIFIISLDIFMVKKELCSLINYKRKVLTISIPIYWSIPVMSAIGFGSWVLMKSSKIWLILVFVIFLMLTVSYMCMVFWTLFRKIEKVEKKNKV